MMLSPQSMPLTEGGQKLITVVQTLSTVQIAQMM